MSVAVVHAEALRISCQAVMLVALSRTCTPAFRETLGPISRYFVTSSAIMQPSSSEEEPIRYPVPPFTEETAKQKVKAAQVRRSASKGVQLACLSYRLCHQCIVPCRMPGIPRTLRRYHWPTHPVGVFFNILPGNNSAVITNLQICKALLLKQMVSPAPPDSSYEHLHIWCKCVRLRCMCQTLSGTTVICSSRAGMPSETF